MSKIINIRTDNINIFGIISNFKSLENSNIQLSYRYIFSCPMLNVQFRLLDLETAVTINEEIPQTENGGEISDNLVIYGSNAPIQLETILGVEFKFRFETLSSIRQVSPGSLIFQVNTGKIVGLLSGKYPGYATRMNYIVESIIEDFLRRNQSIERLYTSRFEFDYPVSTEFEEEFKPTNQKYLDDDAYKDLQMMGLSPPQSSEISAFVDAGYSELLPFIFTTKKSRGATELWFYRSHHYWYWSPPIEKGHLNWKRISDNDDFRVVGGTWNGIECVRRNRNLIERLRLDGASYLREEYVKQVQVASSEVINIQKRTIITQVIFTHLFFSMKIVKT